MSAKSKLQERVRELGATMTEEVHGDSVRLGVEAPKGSRFATEELHELVDWTYRPWKPDYADVLSRMSHGIEKCPHEDCEWCHPDDN